MDEEASPSKKPKQDPGESPEGVKDNSAGCSDDKKPLEEEVNQILFPCIIGFIDRKLRYWTSTAEMDSEPKVIADWPLFSNPQTFTAVAVNHQVTILTWDRYCYALDLDRQPRNWISLDALHHFHGSYPPATVLGGIIYVCGGGFDWEDTYKKDGTPMRTTTAKCERLVDGVWSEMADMEARGRNCAAAVKGHVYSIGGWNSAGEALNTVERYDPSGDRRMWEKVSPLNEARYDASAVAHDEKLYVSGGLYSAKEKRLSIECYDPDTLNWTLLTLACHISTFSFGGKVIVLPCDDKLKEDRKLPPDDEGVQLELFKPFTHRPDAVIAIE